MDSPRTTQDPVARQGRPAGIGPVSNGKTPTSAEPIMPLRGAGVDVDVRRVGRVLAGLCLLALAVLVFVLFIAGAQKNAQITRLHQHGVAVEVTVSSCIGLMGGSGSNIAGYSCRGTFTAGGHLYNDAIPGNTLYRPGARLAAITASGDPGLLSTPRALAAEHASWRVFILPTILLVVLVLLVAAVVLRRRRSLR